MARSRKQRRGGSKDPATEAFEAGYELVRKHALFGPLLLRAHVHRSDRHPVPGDGWTVASGRSSILAHPTRPATPQQWARGSLPFHPAGPVFRIS